MCYGAQDGGLALLCDPVLLVYKMEPISVSADLTQQQQHHCLGTYHKRRFSGSTPDLLNQDI